MNLDWTHFTPIASLAGGALIGLGAALYLLGNGRIAGIAGIVASPLRAIIDRAPQAPEASRWLFLLGLLVSPWVWRLFAAYPAASVDVGYGVLVVAGLLVGIGSRMGNGCTSGHGVCGLARGSARSLANVVVFMAVAFATVFVLRHAI
jgi:uncharacterized membrane protein YedE/YeeE